jgi:hypothetical protein
MLWRVQGLQRYGLKLSIGIDVEQRSSPPTREQMVEGSRCRILGVIANIAMMLGLLGGMRGYILCVSNENVRPKY